MRRASRLGLSSILLTFCVQHTWALNGDSWCGTLMCVNAIVNESTVTYELKALNQLGWMSIGFGPQMAGTPLVVMWSNEDGSVSLSQRVADGHVPPRLDPDPPRLATISTPVDAASDTTPILAFDIPNNNDTVQSLVWAFGVSRPLPDSASDIEQHLDAGSFNLDLRRNRGGGEDENGTSSALTSTPTVASATSASALVPSLSGQSSLTSIHAVSPAPSTLSSPSAPPQNEPSDSPAVNSDIRALHIVLAVHAILSLLGFCVFLPLAVIYTRWYRTVSPRWLRVHWSMIAFLAAPAGILGSASGPVVVALRGRQHVVNEHQICGVILLALCLVQVVFGVFIHRRQPKHGRIHPLRNIVHVVLGLTIIGLSFYEIKTGITREAALSSSARNGLIVGTVILAILVAIAYLTGVVRLRRQFDQERLGWHLSLASGSNVTRTGFFAHQREAPRNPSIGRRSASYRTEDGTHDGFGAASSNGVAAREGSDGMPPVEMRELQSPVPISVLAQHAIHLY